VDLGIAADRRRAQKISCAGLGKEKSGATGMSGEHWHETEIRVRYKDTDRMGVVYHGNYLTFFEIGRAELMRDLGCAYSKLEADGYHLVVIEAAAKYHANVGYDSVVTVKSRIAELRGARIRFDYRVVSEEGKLLVSGHTVHACILSNQKPTRIPAGVKALIEGKVAISSTVARQRDG
jgi:acyl-CoA thioester hydrolase